MHKLKGKHSITLEATYNLHAVMLINCFKPNKTHSLIVSLVRTYLMLAYKELTSCLHIKNLPHACI